MNNFGEAVHLFLFEENDQALLDFVSYAKKNFKILDKNIDFSILNLLPMHKRQNDIVPLLLDLPLSFLTFDHREHLLKRLVDTFNVSSVKLILNDIETRGSRKTLRNEATRTVATRHEPVE